MFKSLYTFLKNTKPYKVIKKKKKKNSYKYCVLCFVQL